MKNSNMEKINLLKIKKEIIALALAASMTGSMAGCKKAEVDPGISVITNPTTTTTTTVAPTETTAATTVTPTYETEANALYEEYKAYFQNQYGENKEYAIKEIKNVIMILSNKSETITNEDLRNAFYAIDNMFMPTNVIQAAGNYITGEAVEHVENVPSLGRFIQDPQARTIINENTCMVNNFIDAMNNGTPEAKEAAKILLLQRVATIERDLDEYYHLGELSNGDELALNESNKGLVNLAGSLCENGVLKYTDEEEGVKQTIFLIPDTYGAAVLNTFRLAEAEGTPYDTQTIKVDGKKTTVNGRYVEYLGPKGFTRKFVTLAEKNTIEDTLAITKYDEAIYALQSEYSRISTEYYKLNNGCEKTLTK